MYLHFSDRGFACFLRDMEDKGQKYAVQSISLGPVGTKRLDYTLQKEWDCDCNY